MGASIMDVVGRVNGTPAASGKLSSAPIATTGQRFPEDRPRTIPIPDPASAAGPKPGSRRSGLGACTVLYLGLSPAASSPASHPLSASASTERDAGLAAVAGPCPALRGRSICQIDLHGSDLS